MDKQTKEARQIAKKLPLNKKAEYIWDYYKWWIIIPIICVVFFVITVVQISSIPKGDIDVVYYTNYYVSDEAVQEVSKYLSQYVEDIDGDGEKKVNIVLESVPSGNHNMEFQSAYLMKFIAQLTAAEYPLYLLQGDMYETSKDENAISSFEEYIPVSENQELSEMLSFSEANQVYWVRRKLYPKEKEKQEAVKVYEMVKEIENKLFK